jgi:protein TonB
MAGGGEAERGRATSPLPAAFVSLIGDDQANDRERQLSNMQEQQAMILAEVKTALSALPPPDPKRQSASTEQIEREQKRRELIKLLAEIERRINMENARPKKRYVSPATLARVDAVYYDHMRRAIEDKGTQNFPEQGGQKLYGELTMIVTVNHDGRVIDTEVVQTSGNPVLDRRAQAIARGAGPFGQFSPEMRRQQDQMAIPSRFKFTREDTLEAKPSLN